MCPHQPNVPFFLSEGGGVARVEPVVVRLQSRQAGPIDVSCRQLGQANFDAIRLAYRAQGEPRSNSPPLSPIAIRAMVDRDEHGACTGLHVIDIALGGGAGSTDSWAPAI